MSRYITESQKARHRETSKKSWHKNKHKHLEARRIKNKKWRDDHKDQRIEYFYKKRFGITKSDYDRLWKDQKGVCFICGGVSSAGRMLAVDHDHETGVIRGLVM